MPAGRGSRHARATRLSKEHARARHKKGRPRRAAQSFCPCAFHSFGTSLAPLRLVEQSTDDPCDEKDRRNDQRGQFSPVPHGYGSLSRSFRILSPRSTYQSIVACRFDRFAIVSESFLSQTSDWRTRASS